MAYLCRNMRRYVLKGTLYQSWNEDHISIRFSSVNVEIAQVTKIKVVELEAIPR